MAEKDDAPNKGKITNDFSDLTMPMKKEDGVFVDTSAPIHGLAYIRANDPHSVLFDPLSVVDDGKIKLISGASLDASFEVKRMESGFNYLNANDLTFKISGASDGLISAGTKIPDTLHYFIKDYAAFPTADHEQQKFDDEINSLKSERVELLEELRQSKNEIDKTKSRLDEANKQKLNVDAIKTEYDSKLNIYEEKIKLTENKSNELIKNERLNHIRSCVNDDARKALNNSEGFRKLFEDTTTCDSFVMAIDLRRSTDLMLKARSPKHFAKFIISLCDGIHDIIVKNYGVFEKFTGDGVLSFFPDFYSEKDAGLLAVRTAFECHSFFTQHYNNNRSCFSSILKDVGLGIGLDFGNIHMVKMQNALSIVGTPVVYACRLSGAKANQTLINQPGFELLEKNFGQYMTFSETYLDLKHEGLTLAYEILQTKKELVAKIPEWVKKSQTPE